MTKHFGELANNTITFHDGINKFLEELQAQGKSGKGVKFRKVPIGKATVKVVNDWLENRKDTETDYLFTSKRSPKLTDRVVQHLFERISKTVGFKVTPHMCRHTFCKQIADKTGKLDVVADLAGHTNIKTSRRYVTPSMKKLKKTVEDAEFEG